MAFIRRDRKRLQVALPEMAAGVASDGKAAPGDFAPNAPATAMLAIKEMQNYFFVDLPLAFAGLHAYKKIIKF